jgi:hypothetical protein
MDPVFVAAAGGFAALVNFCRVYHRYTPIHPYLLIGRCSGPDVYIIYHEYVYSRQPVTPAFIADVAASGNTKDLY